MKCPAAGSLPLTPLRCGRAPELPPSSLEHSRRAGAPCLTLLPGRGAAQVVAAAGAVDHADLVKLSEKAFTGLSTDPTTAYDLAQKVRRPAPSTLMPTLQSCVWRGGRGETGLLTALQLPRAEGASATSQHGVVGTVRWWRGRRCGAQEPSYFTGSEVRMRDPDQPVLTFAVAFKGVSCADADSVPLMIMQQMLGSWNKASPYGDASASRAPSSPLLHIHARKGNTWGAAMPPTYLDSCQIRGDSAQPMRAGVTSFVEFNCFVLRFCLPHSAVACQ